MRHWWIAATALLLPSAPGWAAVTPSQAEALGGRLTPVGAERAGNAAGTIPPWTGGVHDGGGISVDRFAGERPVLVIDAANAQRFSANLPDGALAMFRRYPDYRMRVFPTHRTAAMPESVYQATARNALTAHAGAGGIADGVAGAAGGVPFPLPSSGAELVWNHLLSFWGVAREAHVSTFVAPGDGTVVRAAGYREITDFPYHAPGATPQSIGPYYFKTRRVQDWPPASDGGGYIAWQPLDIATDRFVAWRYLPGEHRARRAPSLSYDTPDPDSSGYESLDDYYLFFGGQDRYNFRILGKREMFVPYNNNQLVGMPARLALGPTHANPDALRYELHRVWVVEGTLAAGQHDIVSRRRLYLDEDTWHAVYSDEWDEDGRLWKFGETTMMLVASVPAVIGGSWFVYDLQQGGYCYDFALSSGASYVVTAPHDPGTFSGEAMAADALR